MAAPPLAGRRGGAALARALRRMHSAPCCTAWDTQQEETSRVGGVLGGQKRVEPRPQAGSGAQGSQQCPSQPQPQPPELILPATLH